MLFQTNCSGDEPGYNSRELSVEAPWARMEEVTPSSHLTLAGFSQYKDWGWNLDREGVISVLYAVCLAERPQIEVLYV